MVGFLTSPIVGYSNMGVAMVLLGLGFASGWFFDAWLSFGKVVLDFQIGLRVCCEGDYSSLDVVSLFVY